MKRNRSILDTLKVIVVCVVVFVLAGGGFYAFTILPMEECMDEGHSFNYCYQLLHR